MPKDTADVVIVGGGIIGCSLAYHLTRRGVGSVRLLEKNALASGATGICPGGIRQQFQGEADCVMARHSYRFWNRINEALEPDDPFEFERSGYLFLADSPGYLKVFRENVALQNRLGIPSEILSPDQIAGILPDLELEGVAGGSYCGEDGFVEDCHGVSNLMARRAVQAGARVDYEEVLGLSTDGRSWQVETRSDPIQCAQVVLACAAAGRGLARQVGIDLPVRPERRRLIFTSEYADQVMSPLVVAPERGFAGKQLPYGVFYLGWLREEPDQDDLDFAEKALLSGSSLLPLLADLPIRRVLAGEYDNTPDHRPILGEVPERDGLYLALGFSGHGFMIAPAVGDALADEMAGGGTELPLSDFSLTRFGSRASPEGLVI